VWCRCAYQFYDYAIFPFYLLFHSSPSFDSKMSKTWFQRNSEKDLKHYKVQFFRKLKNFVMFVDSLWICLLINLVAIFFWRTLEPMFDFISFSFQLPQRFVQSLRMVFWLWRKVNLRVSVAKLSREARLLKSLGEERYDENIYISMYRTPRFRSVLRNPFPFLD